MRGGLLILVLLAATLVAALAGVPSSSSAQVGITPLTPEFEPLRADFNQAAGKVRLLLLLDPT